MREYSRDSMRKVLHAEGAMESLAAEPEKNIAFT